jgi:hypothetical protein
MITDTIMFVNELYSPTQRDGFGFSIQCEEGRYTEKYTDPKTYSGIGRLATAVRSVDKFFAEEYLNKFESPKEPFKKASGPMIIHGRTSTGLVSIENTHPFSKSEWTLAHNGIVGWAGEQRNMETTCDSEHLLNCYALGEGTEDFESLNGWAAWVAINPNGQLVAGRDKITPLHIAYSQKLATYIIATKEDDLKIYLKEFDIKATGVLSMPQNSETVFSPSGKDVRGKKHKGLAEAKWAGVEQSLQLALGMSKKTHYKATKSQILGRSINPYTGHAIVDKEDTELWPWPDSKQADNSEDLPQELIDQVKEWESENLHNIP